MSQTNENKILRCTKLYCLWKKSFVAEEKFGWFSRIIHSHYITRAVNSAGTYIVESRQGNRGNLKMRRGRIKAVRNTSFETSLRHRKNIWKMCSLLVLASQCVYVPKIHFKLFLQQHFFLIFFRIFKIDKVSRLHDTITETWYFVYLHAYEVSHRRDSITSLW